MYLAFMSAAPMLERDSVFSNPALEAFLDLYVSISPWAIVSTRCTRQALGVRVRPRLGFGSFQDNDQRCLERHPPRPLPRCHHRRFK